MNIKKQITFKTKKKRTKRHNYKKESIEIT